MLGAGLAGERRWCDIARGSVLRVVPVACSTMPTVVVEKALRTRPRGCCISTMTRWVGLPDESAHAFTRPSVASALRVSHPGRPRRLGTMLSRSLRAATVAGALLETPSLPGGITWSMGGEFLARQAPRRRARDKQTTISVSFRWLGPASRQRVQFASDHRDGWNMGREDQLNRAGIPPVNDRRINAMAANSAALYRRAPAAAAWQRQRHRRCMPCARASISRAPCRLYTRAARRAGSDVVAPHCAGDPMAAGRGSLRQRHRGRLRRLAPTP